MKYVCVMMMILHCASSENHQVIGSGVPLYVEHGSNVLLPCWIEPSTSALDMRVEWFRTNLVESVVHLYKDHENINTGQIQSFRGRTALFKDELQKGNASLLLTEVQVADDGDYTCHIQAPTWDDDITIRLKVTVVGTDPVITLERFDNSGGFSLLCDSKGWWPEPELQWMGNEGINLTNGVSETHREGELFNVKHRIFVPNGGSGSFYCRVKQLHHMKESEIVVSNQIFSTWKAAVITLSITCVIIITAIGVVVVMLWKVRCWREEDAEKVKFWREEDAEKVRRCREEEAEKVRRWREEDAEKMRRWREEDAEKVRLWREEDAEKVRRWREEDAEKVRRCREEEAEKVKLCREEEAEKGMDTTVKKMKMSVEGYIHDVSEIKKAMSSSKYFTAVMQEATMSSRLVVFQVEQHQNYCLAERNGCPVKLENVIFRPSRQRVGENDIIAGAQSTMSSLRCLPFPCDVSKNKHDVQRKSLAEIAADPIDYQRVNVTVKLLEERERGEALTRTNKKLPKILYAVADHTDSLCLTVWGDKKLEIGRWYDMKSVSVRMYLGKPALSTTVQTVIQEVVDAGNAAEAVKDDAELVVGEILTADVAVQHFCPKRHLLDAVNPKTFMTRCHHCGVFVKNNKIETEVLGKLSVVNENGDQHSFNISDNVLRSVLTFSRTDLPNAEDLVRQLLEYEHAKILCRFGRVVSVHLMNKAGESADSKNTVPESSGYNLKTVKGACSSQEESFNSTACTVTVTESIDEDLESMLNILEGQNNEEKRHDSKDVRTRKNKK